MNCSWRILFLFILMSASFSTHGSTSKNNAKYKLTEETVTIRLKDEVQIEGTLSGPVGSDRLIILVSPPLSGNRDLSGKGISNNMFKTLADELNRNGYAVFRFDNRGTGKSNGDRNLATLHTHAEDVNQIVNFLATQRQGKAQRIVLLGISEGGSVCQVVVSMNSKISALIMLSVQGIKGYDFFSYQTQKTFDNMASMYKEKTLIDSIARSYDRLSRPLYTILASSTNEDTIRAKIQESLMTHLTNSPLNPKQIELEMARFSTWYQPQQIALRKFDPILYLSKITCPVLAMCGDKDHQVDCIPNLLAIESILEAAGNKNITTVALKGVNHQYRTLSDKPFWELADKNEKFSADAMQSILKWLSSIE